MATPQFNPDRPSGIGVDGEQRWITQGPWKFDPLTKELLPGQFQTEVPAEARAAPPVSETAAGAELPSEPMTRSPFPAGKKIGGKKRTAEG